MNERFVQRFCYLDEAERSCLFLAYMYAIVVFQLIERSCPFGMPKQLFQIKSFSIFRWRIINTHYNIFVCFRFITILFLRIFLWL